MAASRRSLGQERHHKEGFKVLPASNILTAQGGAFDEALLPKPDNPIVNRS
jgi:hypothetical protein